jgi:hypothetical protein
MCVWKENEEASGWDWRTEFDLQCGKLRSLDFYTKEDGEPLKDFEQ